MRLQRLTGVGSAYFDRIMKLLRLSPSGARYLLAIAAPMAAAAIVVLWGRWTDGSTLFGVFGVAVFVTAIAGGLWPGLVATVVSTILGLAIWTDWLGILPAVTGEDPARVAVITVTGVVASLLGGRVHTEQDRLDRARAAEARAHAASEAALTRLGTLQSLTVDLSRSLTTTEVAEAVVRHGHQALRAHAGIAYLASADGAFLDLATAIGYPNEIVERFRRVRADGSLPAAAVVAAGSAVFLADADSYRARFPDVEAITGRSAPSALAMVPLRSAGMTVGAIGWTFTAAQTFDDDRRSFILTMGNLCSQAMERARAYEAERASRQRGDRLARREAERSAELNSIITAIGEGILVVEPDGRVRSMNDAAERALGGPVRDWNDLRDRLQLDGEHLPPPGSPFGPTEYQPKGRPGAWVELAAYVVRADETVDADDPEGQEGVGDRARPDRTTVWLVRDVSAFRQGQRLREAFLGLLSHELRTPVTTIYAAANVLGRSERPVAPEVRQDILEDIVGESNRLYRLVEDLLVLARFDEGFTLGGDPNLVHHLARNVVASEALRWPAIAFAVETGGLTPTVSGDETSIQQVIRNLISNAAKYSAPGSTVKVVVEGEPDGATVRVLDEGVGIRVEEVDKLFDPFYRSPASAKMAGGAGIGLYVCRRLVEAMGGRVWARPRTPRGSEFGFWLPAYEDASIDLDDAPWSSEAAGPTDGVQPAEPTSEARAGSSGETAGVAPGLTAGVSPGEPAG
jgi:signal transduction histidine kinase